MALSASPPPGSSSSGPRLAIDPEPDAGLDHLRHLFELASVSESPDSYRGSAWKSQRGLCDFSGDLMRKGWRTFIYDLSVRSRHLSDAVVRVPGACLLRPLRGVR